MASKKRLQDDININLSDTSIDGCAVAIGQVTAKRIKIKDSPPKVPADSKVSNIAEHGVKQININRDEIKIKQEKTQISKVVDQADEKSSNQASEETTTIDVAEINKRRSIFVDVIFPTTTAFAKRKITFRVKEETFSIGRRLLLEKAPHMETLLIPNDTTVLIENAEPEIFKAMLYFIQNGSIMFKTINRLQATSLLEIAVKYKLDKLKQLLCDDFFLNTITHETVVDYLILAYEHNMEALKTKAFEYVKNYPEIEESESFHKIIKSSNVQLKKDWFIMA